jgi:hypothetical protein
MRLFSPIDFWALVPVANRLVEVNTKTGFGLTAGSYSVRKSSFQRGTITVTSPSTTGTSTISAVTLANAGAFKNQHNMNVAANSQEGWLYLTATTTVTMDNQADTSWTQYTAWTVAEYY